MTPEEKRAKQAEYMRRWRAANPERNRAINRRHAEKWQAAHPEESRDYFRKWKDEHRESVRATTTRSAQRAKIRRATEPDWRDAQNLRAKANYARFSGIPEVELQARFQAENANAVSMDHVRPDFYMPGDGFVEIKRALPFLKYGWRVPSQHFPGLYFQYSGMLRHGKDVDAQLAMQPRPLLVVIYHALTGVEITRKLLI